VAFRSWGGLYRRGRALIPVEAVQNPQDGFRDDRGFDVSRSNAGQDDDVQTAKGRASEPIAQDTANAVAIDCVPRVTLAYHHSQARITIAMTRKDAERVFPESDVGRCENVIESCLVRKPAIGSEGFGTRHVPGIQQIVRRSGPCVRVRGDEQGSCGHCGPPCVRGSHGYACA